MRKNGKRFLCFLLALAMICSGLFPGVFDGADKLSQKYTWMSRHSPVV